MATFSDNPPMYDFDVTDDFLLNLNGAIPNLTPELIIDGNGYTKATFDDPTTMAAANSYNFTQDMGISSADLGSYDMMPVSSEDAKFEMSDFSYIPPVVEDSPISSTNSVSHSSTSGLTPVSQNSSSSNYTSPETIHVKEEVHDNATVRPPRKQSNPKTTTTIKPALNDKVSKPGKKDRCSHNMIEKKYRTNINSKILALRDAVPSLRIATGENKSLSIADLEGLSPASKLNKASVLTKATEYIKHLEKKNDMLKNQNMELQRLIQLANSGRMPTQQQVPHQHIPQPPQQSFGFVPSVNEPSYNTTVVVPQSQQSFAGNNMYGYQGQPEAPGLSNGQKILLGGLATVMGTSVFSGSGSNDYKGLSALPFANFLPQSVILATPLFAQTFHIVKMVVLLGAIANIIYPSIVSSVLASQKDKNLQQTSVMAVYKNYILVNLGLRLPHTVADSKKEEIVNSLLGKSSGALHKLFTAYAYLSSAQINYENCLLTLIVGKMLIVKYPYLSSLFDYNMSTKASILTNLEYNGDDHQLRNLNKLLKKVDGVSMFGSDLLFKKLLNVFEGKAINEDCMEYGTSNSRYAEFFQDQQKNIYGIIFTWRILELTSELNTSYLHALSTSNAEEDETINGESLESVISATELIGSIVDDCGVSKLVKYFKLFKAVILPESATELRITIENDIKNSLETFKVQMDGQDLTDSVSISSSEGEQDDEQPSTVTPLGLAQDEEDEEESVDDEEEEDDFEENIAVKFSQQAKSQNSFFNSSLVNSLNLVNEEEYIVLTCASILMFNKSSIEQSRRLLRHLESIEDTTPLTFLSFTAILNVISTFALERCEHNDVLDNLIRITRVWISDETKRYALDGETRSNIADLVVKKGLILNGFSESENEE